MAGLVCLVTLVASMVLIVLATWWERLWTPATITFAICCGSFAAAYLEQHP